MYIISIFRTLFNCSFSFDTAHLGPWFTGGTHLPWTHSRFFGVVHGQYSDSPSAVIKVFLWPRWAQTSMLGPKPGMSDWQIEQRLQIYDKMNVKQVNLKSSIHEMELQLAISSSMLFIRNWTNYSCLNILWHVWIVVVSHFLRVIVLIVYVCVCVGRWVIVHVHFEKWMEDKVTGWKWIPEKEDRLSHKLEQLFLEMCDMSKSYLTCVSTIMCNAWSKNSLHLNEIN